MKTRALIFAAHPDDIEFGCGGTVLRLAERCAVTLCVLTDGGAGTYGSASARHKEQEAAAAYIGASLRWLGKQDCSIEYTRAGALELAQIIRDEKPDLVLVPHWNQTGGIHDGKAHPDHRHTGLLVRDAARLARFRIPALTGEPHGPKQVWYYMVPDGVPGAIAIPIDDLIPKLRELWSCHTSQLALRDGTVTDHLLHTRGSAASQLRGVQFAELIACDAPINIDVLLTIFGEQKP